MEKHELDYNVTRSEVKGGVREITDVELYATSVMPLESAYPFLHTQLQRPRRGEKRKKSHWFKWA